MSKWRGRFAEHGLDGLHDEPRPGKPRSMRSMAQATVMNQTAVSRIWRAFGMKPHRVEHFKLSPDPQFIDKVRDIVGLYVNPQRLCSCVGEKSQIQALDRTAPVVPPMPRVLERRYA